MTRMRVNYDLYGTRGQRCLLILFCYCLLLNKGDATLIHQSPSSGVRVADTVTLVRSASQASGQISQNHRAGAFPRYAAIFPAAAVRRLRRARRSSRQCSRTARTAAPTVASGSIPGRISTRSAQRRSTSDSSPPFAPSGHARGCARRSARPPKGSLHPRPRRRTSPARRALSSNVRD
jgi:hypothetical protein